MRGKPANNKPNPVTHQNLREQKNRCTSRVEMWEQWIFGLMVNRERRMKGRMAKIRGKKKSPTFIADQTQVFATSHPKQLSLHNSSKAKRWGKA